MPKRRRGRHPEGRRRAFFLPRAGRRV